jgi:hypothetical protein
MYKFYQDKTEDFIIKDIRVTGASLSKTKARLVLENEEYNLVFNGEIDESGRCVIPVPKLKILSENLKGNLKVEVIVEDDSIFVPYKDTFEIGVSRKVTVEVAKQDKAVISESKKKVTVVVESKKQEKQEIHEHKAVNVICKIFEKKGINLLNMKGNKEVPTIISEVIKHFKVKDTEIKTIQEQLLKKLILEYKD